MTDDTPPSELPVPRDSVADKIVFVALFVAVMPFAFVAAVLDRTERLLSGGEG